MTRAADGPERDVERRDGRGLPVLLKACLNGARLPPEHPALPITPRQLAADAAACRAADASAVHLHVKDQEGKDTLDGSALARTLDAVREASPGLPIGITTGAWAVSDPDERTGLIRSWTSLPDFASVNWHEDGAEDVAGALLSRGIDVEAGLWHQDAVALWLESGHRQQCLRVLIELPDGLDSDGTAREARKMLTAVHSSGNVLPVLLHGEGTSAWPALRMAAAAGLATRIGLEDVLHLPDGSPAPDNLSLVHAAREIIARSATPHAGVDT